LETVATQDLCRNVGFAVRATAAGEENDGFTIDGYAAVYDTPTRIDSWEGRFDEQIAFGAFGRSIRAKMPKMQFDHGTHPLLGSLPLGNWTSMKEEKGVGLHTIGRLSDNWLVEPFRQAMMGDNPAVDGMSFRFSVMREKWTDKRGEEVPIDEVPRLLWEPDPKRGVLLRTLLEVRITEAGPVVWPAYEETTVGVRSSTVTIDLDRLHDPKERENLARAVMMADQVESNTDGPQVTVTEPAEPASDEDATRSTEGTPDEHPSAITEAHRRRDRMRAAARSHSGYMLQIRED